MVFLHLIINFYLVILGRYVLKAANNLCSNTKVIHNIDECKESIRYLNKHGVDAVFHQGESSSSYPKGCYKIAGNAYVFWNTRSSGSANDNAKPICKEGE